MDIQRPPTLSGRPASQHADELARFIALLVRLNVRSYCEIGARHGDTFYEVMRALPAGSRGLALDLPGGEWGAGSSSTALMVAVAKLRRAGYDANCVLGDSHAPHMRQIVAAQAPFGALLIDADHRYEPVRQDWLDYGPLAPVVAFHDIAGEGVIQRSSGLAVEVPRLWRELKAVHEDHLEIVAPGSPMGIGVIFR